MTGKNREDSIDGCRAPGVVSRDELLAGASGGRAGLAAGHLSICPACRAEAEAYRRLDHALSVGLFRADCPSAMTLGEFALELLPPEEVTAVRAHLALCPHCAGELEIFAGVARTDPLLDARPGTLRRVVATLLPAAAPRLGAVALRGTQGGGTRTYSADGVSVALSVGLDTAGPPRRWSLVGLVVDESDGERSLTGNGVLWCRGEVVAEAPLDEVEGMTFTGLAKDVYTLEVALGDRVIVVDEVKIGDDAGP